VEYVLIRAHNREEVMTSTGDLRREAHDSASQVLNAVVAELQDLRASYKRVARRIRILRGAVQALRELEHRPDDGLETLSNADKTSRRHFRALTNSIADETFGAVSVVGRSTPMRSEDPALRRACRIALLEAAEPVSTEGVFFRIVRRGSYRFPNDNAALQSIADELKVMREQGEVRELDILSRRHWQRVTPKNDPLDRSNRPNISSDPA
jgi:hypothetical protein